MRRRIKNLITIFIGCLLMVLLLRKCKILPDPQELFSAKPVVIDKTPILIKDIKSIAQLVTITAYDEVVVDSIEINKSSLSFNPFNPIYPIPITPVVSKKLVLIGRGKVLAGTDLKSVGKENFSIKEDTVTLHIPRSIVLDAIMNPSDFETFDEQGKWTPEAVTAVKLKARRKMVDRALQKNILGRANDKAKQLMETFLTSAGFKKVEVVVQ